MSVSILIQNQLLATKFYVPVASGTLILRPRLNTLLENSLKYPLTLVSAPAGFGKTTLLSTWAQSLQVHGSQVCWISLDEEDNEPYLFWTYVLSALKLQHPERFSSLLMHLQSQPPPPFRSLLSALINLLAENTDCFVLILDDYHVITEEQVHTALTYLIEHSPAQLRIILSTRADPPLPLPQMRVQRQVLEVRTDQLRCTVEETAAFFNERMKLQLSDETTQEIRNRTEGWLVGLQLLTLSLPEQVNPLTLLKEVSGDQRYILDYLTEEILQRQPQEMQTFLLSTCILRRLTASLCDAVMEQTGSQQMLRQLEQANLFVVSLDNRRQWYRYHTLFTQALYYQLKQTRADLLPGLHYRASHWYAEHEQITEAILHALHAQEWQWTADLIEQKSFQLMSFNWGASHYALAQLQQWVGQLPAEVISSRPRLCLACIHMLFTTAPLPMLEAWLDIAEASLTALLNTQIPEDSSSPTQVSQARREQEYLLATAITARALLRSVWEDQSPTVLALVQRVLSLLSPENAVGHANIAWPQAIVLYNSSDNDATAAIERGLYGISLAQAAGQPAIAINLIGGISIFMIAAGRLHEAQQLAQQAIYLGSRPEGPSSPARGWSAIFQAEILREWNQLDAAYSLVQEGLTLCQQAESVMVLLYTICGYAVLLRIALSLGDLDAARSALQQVDRISESLNQPFSLLYRSLYTTIDQIRLWLACGELESAIRWIEALEDERHGTPISREHEEVACARVLIAKHQPILALERLEPVLQRATTGQRWRHVIEIQLLQALAYQMYDNEAQALDILAEAVRLAEPEGYIRTFVDEGAAMESLLYQLHKRDLRHGPTPYLDTLLAAFQPEKKAHVDNQEYAKVSPNSLSKRELEVLELLVQGASNQEIAQDLVITVDTVKRHVSHIFAKLGAQNRVQAVKQAQALGLLRH